MNVVVIRGRDRWIFAASVLIIIGIVAAVVLTTQAGMEGIVRRDDWSESADFLADLSERGQMDGVQIVDARSYGVFAGGHVQGAKSLPAERLVDDLFGSTVFWHEIVDVLGRSGVKSDMTTIVYAADPKDAAYVLWVLRAAGLKDVKLLQGGIMALVEEGVPIVAVETAGTDWDDAHTQVLSDVGTFLSQPDPSLAIDFIDLYQAAAVQLVDTRAQRNEEIALDGANRFHLVGSDLVTGDGIKRSRIAINNGLRPIKGEEVVVYSDDVRDAALVWWIAASEGRSVKLFVDGFHVWRESGMPVDEVESVQESVIPAGMRLGGGCG